jgi:hypothetical protein
MFFFHPFNSWLLSNDQLNHLCSISKKIFFYKFIKLASQRVQTKLIIRLGSAEMKTLLTFLLCATVFLSLLGYVGIISFYFSPGKFGLWNFSEGSSFLTFIVSNQVGYVGSWAYWEKKFSLKNPRKKTFCRTSHKGTITCNKRARILFF